MIMQGVLYPQKGASLGWLVQAVSGLLLIVLLGLHLIANHFVVPGGLQTYQDVVHYLSNPLILVLEVLFLIVVTAHALLGVRAVILDTSISQRTERSLNTVLIVLGVLIVLYGFWLTFIVIR
jgi:succinate dehydrogenase hydrophobic anchor subunit